MKIYKGDVTDTIAWIASIMFIVAIAYLADGGQSILVFLFTLILGMILVRSFWESTSKYLEEYYWNKREKRNREELRKQGTI